MPVCHHAYTCICCILRGFIAFWTFEINLLTYLLTYLLTSNFFFLEDSFFRKCNKKYNHTHTTHTPTKHTCIYSKYSENWVLKAVQHNQFGLPLRKKDFNSTLFLEYLMLIHD